MNTMERLSQRHRIKQHLITGWSITPLEALNRYGCFRLAAVIHKLRDEEGMPIKTIPTTDRNTGKTYATYRLDQVIEVEGRQESLFTESDSPTQ